MSFTSAVFVRLVGIVFSLIYNFFTLFLCLSRLVFFYIHLFLLPSLSHFLDLFFLSLFFLRPHFYLIIYPSLSAFSPFCPLLLPPHHLFPLPFSLKIYLLTFLVHPLSSSSSFRFFPSPHPSLPVRLALLPFLPSPLPILISSLSSFILTFPSPLLPRVPFSISFLSLSSTLPLPSLFPLFPSLAPLLLSFLPLPHSAIDLFINLYLLISVSVSLIASFTLGEILKPCVQTL